MRRFLPISGLLLAAGLGVLACAHGAEREINVDEVQGQASQIERDLREMRAALKERDVPRATEAFQRAELAMQENRDTLAAYPELNELKASIRESAERLCYGAVDVALERCFQAVRDKQLEPARRLLTEAQREHERCKPRISGREDYLPLKLNLDSAPQTLAALEREIARPGMQKRIDERLRALRERLAAADEKLAAFESRPLERELAAALDEELGALGKELSTPWDLSSEPEWVEPAAALQAELSGRTGRLSALVRRGKLRWLAERDLPAAAAAAGAGQAALKTLAKLKPKTPPEAREEVKKLARDKLTAARDLYRGCQPTLAAVLKEEPGLSKTTWLLSGKKRTPGQLQQLCKTEAARLDAALTRLDRPPPKPPKPKKTGRRIQRW